MTTVPAHDIRSEARHDIDSLQEQSTHTLIVAVLVGAGVWLSALALRVPNDTLRMWIMPTGLALTGFLGLWAHAVNRRRGRALFLMLLIAALALGMYVESDLQSAYYLVLVVLASSAMADPRGTLLATVAVSLTIILVSHLWGLAQLPQTYVRAIVLAWVVCGISWLSTRNLYIAVEWANQSQAAAQERLEDLRSRRAELRQLTDMLRINQERLHYLNVRLEQAKVAAEEAYRTKQHFVANVSHELRTPLNLITGFAEMMAFAPDSYGGVRLPRSYRQDVLEVYRSSRHLVSLVEDVLALAQLEAGQMLIKRDWTDLNVLLREVADTMRPLITAKGLALHYACDPLPPVFCDAGRIRQILLNLLNNAYRYTETGAITLGATSADGEVLLAVTDTGVGIAEQDAPLIFEEFHKLGQGTSSQRSDGFGLGLSISRRLAEAHGGRLWVDSAAGRGSTFTLALPVEHVPTNASYPTLVRTSPSAHGVRSLPVVMTISESADDLIGAHIEGFEMVHTTMDECTAAFDRYQPSALLVNAQPGNGALPADLASILREAPALPVITCRLPTRQDLARQLKADTVLSKPIARADLLATVQSLSATAPVRTILIVDDEEPMVRMLARALDSADEEYSVREALGGIEALDLLQQELPDLLLLDLNMPQVSGYEVLSWLQSRPQTATVRVVLITGVQLGSGATRVYDIGLHSSAGLGMPRALQVIAALVEQSLPRAPVQD
jgi:signal transduction histidine kinase/CheY-like chemotaxis protein